MIGALGSVAARYLHNVRDELCAALGTELFGMYLYGSGVTGPFLDRQSDLDVIVVVDDWLAPGTVRRTLERARGVARPDIVKGLDAWVVPRHSASTPQPDPPFECWLHTSIDSELLAGEHHPGDGRLALAYQQCRDHAVALAGPPPLQVFGEVEPSWVIDAMRVDLSLRGAAGWYRVLNACRTAHFLDEGSMCGKLEGAAWYRTRTADPGLIDAALTWRLTGRGPALPRDAVDEFVGVVLARLSEASPRIVPAGLPSAERGPLVEIGSQPPLVSCVLTGPANAELLALAARRFIQQDWADRELLVLRPPSAVNAVALPLDPRIRTVDISETDRDTWRDVALAEARGAILAAWDPLTWYATDRLTHQVGEVLSSPVARLVMPSILAFDPLTGITRRVTEAAIVEQSSLCALRHAWALDGAPARAAGRDNVAVLLDPHVARTRGDPAFATDATRLLGDHRDVYTVAVATIAAGGEPRRSVSCLMPTYNRRRFAARAIDAFLAQDYPERELVILDDGEDAIGDLIRRDTPVRYHRLPQRATIGRKRQILCDLADGDLLVQWDDDDWYSPLRLQRQLAPLNAGAADIAGILHGFIVDTQTMRFWRGELPLHEGRLHAVIVAGTLAFTRAAWKGAGGYPDRSIGEEVALLEAVLANDGRVAPIVNDGIYICVRHGANSWRLRFDAIQGPPGWTEVANPNFLPAADLAFYRSLSSGGVPAAY